MHLFWPSNTPFPLEDAILILKHLANQILFLTLHNLCKWGKHCKLQAILLGKNNIKDP